MTASRTDYLKHMGTAKEHRYPVRTRWTGQDVAPLRLPGFSRLHEISAPGRPPLQASADKAFGGDGSLYNPEDFLVAATSECHMLWYLILCAQDRITVVDYVDDACGTLVQDADGGGRFTEIVLRPQVRVAAGTDAESARRLHQRAHELCFVANSLSCPVRCDPTVTVADPTG